MQKRAFQRLILDYYRESRRDLPWRNTTDPYAILVSEIMLQQTQVDRVIPKFLAWMTKFPTPKALAEASLGDVLIAWSGLGYNRRAKFLWLAAQKAVSDFGSQIPNTYDSLLTLPGVGRYTAGAVLAFAYNKPALVVETNIRAVYIHVFFPDMEKVDDALLVPLIEETMDRTQPRQWFNALMDYGAKLKSEGTNPTRKSVHYTRQSTFNGSNRQIRGAILKALARAENPLVLDFDPLLIKKNLEALAREGLLVKKGDTYSLPK